MSAKLRVDTASDTEKFTLSSSWNYSMRVRQLVQSMHSQFKSFINRLVKYDVQLRPTGIWLELDKDADET